MRRNKFLLLNYFSLLLFLASIFVSCSAQPEYIPSSAGEFKLKQKVTGKEADKQLNKLHFNPIVTGKKNEIGYYEAAGKNAVVYITGYINETDAKTDFGKMTKKISPENSVFISPSFFNFMGYNIYRCFGMGQTHFVFVHENVLIWISVETIAGREFLKSYINVIK